jgi:hypothetical protein
MTVPTSICLVRVITSLRLHFDPYSTMTENYVSFVSNDM